jgi:hypothetical protein
MKLLIAGAILITSLSSHAWFWSKEEWTGFVYPNKHNLINFKIHGVYENVNRCLSEGMRLAEDQGSYECGLNCDSTKSPMVCEKTIGNEK